MRLTRGLRGGGSLSLLSCSCSSTTGLRSQPRLMAAPKVSAFSHLLYHLLTKLGASSPLGGLELRQSQGRRISRDVVVRWDTRGKKANDKARRRAVRSQKDDAPQETRHHACPALRSVVNIDQTCPWRSALFELPAWLKRQERLVVSHS
jgi:hypothetical protein